MRKLAITTAVVSLFGSVADTAKARQEHDWYNMVRNCESIGIRDMWYTNTGNGFFFGPQFTESTWHDYGGGPVLEMGDRGGRPMHAYSIRYIVAVAERVLRGQGFSAWPNCYGYL